MKEVVVEGVSDLKDGEMKKVEIDGHEILISRIDREYFAVSSSCTHYGAPLEEGMLSGGRVYCPWHHACFNAKTGELHEPPARDALTKYQVRKKGKKVIIQLPDKKTESIEPEMAVYDKNEDDRTFVIVGAGAAGNMAAQTLREDGFQGKIVVITQEDQLPYDRTNLSKSYLQGDAGVEDIFLRKDSFYKDYDIEIQRGKSVSGVNPGEKYLEFKNGESLNYDKVLLATGAHPKLPDVPGIELKNIYTLRTQPDADAIIKAAKKADNVAVIGASFISMEVADSLTKMHLPVTIIAPESVPFETTFGKEIGSMFQQLHIENGLDFRLNSRIDKFEGNGTVESVRLRDGERIDADLVVLGIGVEPATDYLANIDRLPDGSVKVNDYLQLQDDIYAAGDIVTFQDARTKENIRIEHWRTAEQQGRLAAHNMVGMNKSYNSIPFFWTTQAGLHFRYVGHAAEWDEIIIQGAVNFRKFIAYFVKEDQVYAVAGNNRDQEMDAAEELMRQGRMPSPKELRESEIDLLSLIDR